MTTSVESIHILVVEDDDDHAALITRVLTQLEPGYQITRLKDGAEALSFLDYAASLPEHQLPNLVLLDLKLPKIGGHEVLARMKSDMNFRSIPVVILTTSDAEFDKKLAYEHYANSYLVKPMGAGQFRKLLGELNNYWSHLNKTISEKA